MIPIVISIKITTSQYNIVSGKECNEPQRTDGLFLNNDVDSLRRSRYSEPQVKEYINGTKPQLADSIGQNHKKSTKNSSVNPITGTLDTLIFC